MSILDPDIGSPQNSRCSNRSSATLNPRTKRLKTTAPAKSLKALLQAPLTRGSRKRFSLVVVIRKAETYFSLARLRNYGSSIPFGFGQHLSEAMGINIMQQDAKPHPDHSFTIEGFLSFWLNTRLPEDPIGNCRDIARTAAFGCNVGVALEDAGSRRSCMGTGTLTGPGK